MLCCHKSDGALLEHLQSGIWIIYTVNTKLYRISKTLKTHFCSTAQHIFERNLFQFSLTTKVLVHIGIEWAIYTFFLLSNSNIKHVNWCKGVLFVFGNETSFLKRKGLIRLSDGGQSSAAARRLPLLANLTCMHGGTQSTQRAHASRHKGLMELGIHP